jgi:hypothetical protein
LQAAPSLSHWRRDRAIDPLSIVRQGAAAVRPRALARGAGALYCASSKFRLSCCAPLRRRHASNLKWWLISGSVDSYRLDQWVVEEIGDCHKRRAAICWNPHTVSSAVDCPLIFSEQELAAHWVGATAGLTDAEAVPSVSRKNR